MDLHAAFLAEICAHPQDDAPRLIYADWLEEQGDPRAAGIRLQCEAAQLPEWHPRRSELELHAALAGLPMCELPQLHRVRWGQSQRGFPHEVRVESWREFEDAAPHIFERAPISSLTIPAARESLQQALDSPCLRRISELRVDARFPLDDLAASQSPGEALTALLGSPMLSRLEELTLAGLHESPRDALSQVAHRLRRLTLSDILLVFPADVEELCAAIEPAPLVALTLAENRLGDGLVQLAHESPRGVETLRIHRNALSRLGMQALVNSSRLEGLRSLELDGNRIAVPGLAALADGFAGLEYLSLAENRLGTHSVQELALAHGLTGLHGLNLSHNSLGSDAFRPLHASRALPQLAHLNLSLNAIDLSGLETLLSTPLVERLESLDLSCNPLRDEGALRLAASPALQNLKWLNLAGATLTAAGARALAESPHLAGLCYLDLRQNAIGDQAQSLLADRFGCAREKVFATERL